MSNQSDWAKEVPKSATKPQGPYEDYGWERGESGLREFRDPSVHTMPYELTPQERMQQFMDSPRGMAVFGLIVAAVIAAIVAGIVVMQQRKD